MGNFNWLQFSDLHFNVGETFDTQITRRALLACLEKEKFECDYVMSFMYGEYDSAKKEIRITPYSYADRGNKRFAKDFSLHRRLMETNNTFTLSRLIESEKNDTELSKPKHSLAHDDLFNRSQQFHDFLRSEKGRFSYLEIQERLFPSAKRPDTVLQGKDDDAPHKLMDVLL